MTAWLVIPVKPPGAGKGRLAPVLSDGERRALVAEMLDHVVSVAAGVGATAHLLGPSAHGLTLPLLTEPGTGLNDAVAAALAAAPGDVDRIVFVAADLPLLTRQDLAALLDTDGIAIATDYLGTGTNALSLPLPAARTLCFAYGPDSLARHLAEAERLGLPAHILRSPTLALDIDTVADLRAWSKSAAGPATAAA